MLTWRVDALEAPGDKEEKVPEVGEREGVGRGGVLEKKVVVRQRVQDGQRQGIRNQFVPVGQGLFQVLN